MPSITIAFVAVDSHSVIKSLTTLTEQPPIIMTHTDSLAIEQSIECGLGLIRSWNVKTKIISSTMGAANILHLINFENPVFASYIFWSCVLLLKTLFMSVFTTVYRSKNKVNIGICFISEISKQIALTFSFSLSSRSIQAHISPEDVAFVKKFDASERKVSHSDRDVERIRRCQFRFSHRMQTLSMS